MQALKRRTNTEKINSEEEISTDGTVWKNISQCIFRR